MRARGFAVNRHALNTLRIRGVSLERGDTIESGPLADMFRVWDCEGCASKVSTALSAVPGVRKVKPKVAQKHVQVTYEPAKVLEDRLKEVIGKAGFTALEA